MVLSLSQSRVESAGFNSHPSSSSWPINNNKYLTRVYVNVAPEDINSTYTARHTGLCCTHGYHWTNWILLLLLCIYSSANLFSPFPSRCRRCNARATWKIDFLYCIKANVRLSEWGAEITVIWAQFVIPKLICPDLLSQTMIFKKICFRTS